MGLLGRERGCPTIAPATRHRTRGSPWDSSSLHRDRCPFSVGQYLAELSAGADAELREHVAQVPFDGARADEQLGADLRIRAAVAGEAGDLGLLCGELVERLDGAFASGFAGGQELARGALGERTVPGVSDRRRRSNAPSSWGRAFRVLQVRRDRRHGTRNARKAGLISAPTCGCKAWALERKGVSGLLPRAIRPAMAGERWGWRRPASAMW
jgi:hypothetical protein